MLAAQLTEKLAKNIIRPPSHDLVEHTVILVSVWEAADPAVIIAAADHTRTRAKDGAEGALGKVILGFLRFLGFGCIEPTGVADLNVDVGEGKGPHTVTATVGVRVESTESLALAVAALGDKIKSIPAGVLCGVVGIMPGKAKLLDCKVDIA